MISALSPRYVSCILWRRGSVATRPKGRLVLTPAAPPQSVPIYSGFDYVTVDAQRRRVYAAHGGSRRLLVVDADTGAIVGQVAVGQVRGVAVDPASGHGYVGTGDNEGSEGDPAALKGANHPDGRGSAAAL